MFTLSLKKKNINPSIETLTWSIWSLSYLSQTGHQSDTGLNHCSLTQLSNVANYKCLECRRNLERAHMVGLNSGSSFGEARVLTTAPLCSPKVLCCASVKWDFVWKTIVGIYNESTLTRLCVKAIAVLNGLQINISFSLQMKFKNFQNLPCKVYTFKKQAEKKEVDIKPWWAGSDVSKQEKVRIEDSGFIQVSPV